MTNRIESPIFNLLSETARLTEFPITITSKFHKKEGVMTRRTIETDPRTTVCREVPMAGDKLIAVNSEHVLIWTCGQGDGVMMTTSDVSEIRPLSALMIRMEPFPEQVPSDLIFDQPGRVFLIHVGRSDEAELQTIQKRAQVENLIHISPDSPDNPDDPDAWRYDQWEVGYDREGATLLIFPGSGDEYSSYHIQYR